MKKSINKKLKIVVLAILLIIIAIITILLYITIKNPGVREEKVALLSYNNKTDIKYNVFLLPNPLYSGDNVEEGKLYLTSFVDYIKISFLYEFNIDRPTDIKGNYEVLVVVEGYTTEEDKVKTIWKKEFILIPKTSFESNELKASIIKEITYSINEYNSFATQIKDLTELDVPIKASVVMNVNLQAKTGINVINKKFTPSIIMPLDTKYFEVIKSGVEEKPEVIEETKQIQLPVNRNLVILYGIIIGTAFLALLYLLIFVKGDAPVDAMKKQLSKIFKSHGTRLVAINNEIGTTFGMYYKVKSIEDLVRIADELGRPILYRYSTDPKEITKFYIHDDKSMFSFNLKDMLSEKDVVAIAKENKLLSDSKEIPLE